MHKFFFCLTLLVLGPCVSAQDEPLAYKDSVYVPNIRSVVFSQAGNPLRFPILSLRSRSGVQLDFDDLDGEIKNYVYSVEHCDAYWKPGSLSEMEYVDGFRESPIEIARPSVATRVGYTHYTLFLPNQNMDFMISGNYLLKVYEDDGEKKLVITRRFLVLDSRCEVQPLFRFPSDQAKSRTHQELDFTVRYDPKLLDIRNPLLEIKACVLQNGRWDNAIYGIQPSFDRGNQLVFVNQDKIVFPAGKEFRALDLRSLRYPIDKIQSIYLVDDGWDVTLKKERTRAYQPYLSFVDINGRFLVEHEYDSEPDISCDYAHVLFHYSVTQELDQEDVYVVGAFSDWELKEENRMIYNPAVNGYVADILLKQGYYNYAYVIRDRKTGRCSWEDTEGDDQEAENEYLFLVYFRPFGQRYDSLVGFSGINSNTR